MKRPKLTPALLERAYRNAYFPMAEPETGDVYWYRPDPRAIIPLDGFHVSKSLQRKLKASPWVVTYDTAFLEVMRACGERKEGTWMNDEFFSAYEGLHKKGKAHSVEVRNADGEIVGGVYGVALGGGFFAESMFHRETDASKAALFHLVERLKACRYELLEVQFLTPHLRSLGAIEISDAEYVQLLLKALDQSTTLFGEPIKKRG